MAKVNQGYLSYEPLSFNVGAPPSWMFNEDWNTFNESGQKAAQAENAQTTADANALLLDQKKKDAEQEKLLEEMTKNMPEGLSVQEMLASVNDVYRKAGNIDKVLDTSKAIVAAQPKPKDRFAISGGYVYDKNDGTQPPQILREPKRVGGAGRVPKLDIYDGPGGASLVINPYDPADMARVARPGWNKRGGGALENLFGGGISQGSRPQEEQLQETPRVVPTTKKVIPQPPPNPGETREQYRARLKGMK